MSQLKRSSVLDYLAEMGAEHSKPSDIIIPEFLYLGDAKTARWFPHHSFHKITHVIYLSGCSNFWDTKEKILKFLGKDDASSNRNDKMMDNEIIPLKYFRIDITDDPSTNISKHFHKCVDFIENARSTNGRVYVHCQAGISRSATI